jgi:hypothetical protein
MSDKDKSEIDKGGSIPMRDVGGGPGWAETRRAIRQDLFPKENPKVKKVVNKNDFA